VKLIPFNFDAFSVLFSDLTFAFMMQHSLPAMIINCKPEEAIKKTLIIVFLFCLCVCILISLIGIAAFGGSMTVFLLL
jgi:amino acid permease